MPTMAHPQQRSGIILAVAATVLFGMIFGLAALLAPLTANEVTGWRVLMVLLVLAPVIGFSRQWRAVAELVARVFRRPLLLLAALGQAALIGVQFWIFMWAPRSEEAVAVTLGYFLLPLGMVIAGRLFLAERSSGWQRSATVLAALGVGYALVSGGSITPMTAVVALGYPAYFVLRKRSGVAGLPGLVLEMALLAPLALLAVLTGRLSPELIVDRPELLGLVLLLGLLTGVAMTTYIRASERLPLGLFGLIGYLEPVLLLLVAVLLGRVLTLDDAITFTPIALSLVLLGVEGLLRGRRRGEHLATRGRRGRAALAGPPTAPLPVLGETRPASAPMRSLRDARARPARR